MSELPEMSAILGILSDDLKAGIRPILPLAAAMVALCLLLLADGRRRSLRLSLITAMLGLTFFHPNPHPAWL